MHGDMQRVTREQSYYASVRYNIQNVNIIFLYRVIYELEPLECHAQFSGVELETQFSFC